MAADPKAADPGRRELCLSLYTTMAVALMPMALAMVASASGIEERVRELGGVLHKLNCFTLG